MQKAYLDWISSLPRILFMTQVMPALTPVMTAKLRACIKGPPERACKHIKPLVRKQRKFCTKYQFRYLEKVHLLAQFGANNWKGNDT